MKAKIRRYWYIGILVLIAVATLILKILTPAAAPVNNKPTAVNAFQGTLPNQSTIADVTKSMGPPDQTTGTQSNPVFNYKSDYGSFPTQFVFNGQTLALSIERLPLNNQRKYDDLYQSLGNPEAVAYTPQQGDIYPLQIFATKGIAFARGSDGLVFEVWRFAPTTLDQFFASIGKDLSRTPGESF